MASSHVKIEDYVGVTLVTFTDSALLETACIDRIGETLYDLVDAQQKRKIVLDFSRVQSLSSHTLGVLLTLRQKAHAVKGTVALCGLRSELMKVFKITNLEHMFEFHPNAPEALL